MASMQHFSIAAVAEQSADFRRVLWTGEHAQLVIMTVPPGGEIGAETHEHNDQIRTFVSGTGEADVAGQTKAVAPGDLVPGLPGRAVEHVDKGLVAAVEPEQHSRNGRPVVAWDHLPNPDDGLGSP